MPVSSLRSASPICRICNDIPEFTILTREPCDGIRRIHDRMPVILPREAARDWFNPACNAMEVMQAAVTTVDFMPVDVVRQFAFVDRERIIDIGSESLTLLCRQLHPTNRDIEPKQNSMCKFNIFAQNILTNAAFYGIIDMQK